MSVVSRPVHKGHLYIADAKTLTECLDKRVFGDQRTYESKRMGVGVGDYAWLYDRAADRLHGPFEVTERPRLGTRDEASYAETFPLLTRVAPTGTPRVIDRARGRLASIGLVFPNVPSPAPVIGALLDALLAIGETPALTGSSSVDTRSAGYWLPPRLLSPSSDEAKFEEAVAELFRYLPLGVERWGAERPGPHPDGRASHLWNPTGLALQWDAKAGRASSSGRPRENDIRALTAYVSEAGRAEGTFDFVVVCAEAEKARQYAACERQIRDRTTEVRHCISTTYAELLDVVVSYLSATPNARASFDVGLQLERRAARWRRA